ncbi:MAG: endonuclease/exonuclease/phosphatase family protein [Candidatus Marinimicrobia bacterium]|nr:endonuclease/exonuclease/phosphatase family protein [Candidatus Neomarinimicrobiota bacterium]
MILLSTAMMVIACAVDTPDNGNTGFPAFPGGDTLVVLTWNLQLFPKSGNSSINYIETAILDMQPDIIAFQEISSESAFRELAGRLDAYSYYLGVNGGNWRLAYFYVDSLVTPDTSAYEIYDNMSRPFPRPPLIMEARWQGEKVIIINNHLKAAGDGAIDTNDSWDEETRRLEAVQLLDDYIKSHSDSENVVVLGDLNDELTDTEDRNVFQTFIDDSLNYRFTDMHIAKGDRLLWSYPSYPSHLDHILISNELFDNHYETQTVLYDTYLDGRWSEYYNYISDHRPVSVSLVIEGVQ